MKTVAKVILGLLVLYGGIAFVRYRILHPDLTETQLLFRSVDALLLRN